MRRIRPSRPILQGCQIRPRRRARPGSRLCEFAAAFLASASLGLPTLAQSSTPTPPQEEERSLIEEIIVTAQKREQRFIDVPVSVETLTAETLQAGQVGVFQDMVEISPSLTHTPSGDMRGDGVLIRGIGTTAFQSGVEPTVSTVVDGVVLGRTGSFLSDLVDIDRVEVLRGPQGTLFGKNASGGVIHIITGRPSGEFESFAEAVLADDSEYQLKGMVSGPLPFGAELSGRITAFAKGRDGYINNLRDGRKLNGSDSYGLRGKLLWQPTEDLSVLFIADVSELDRNCCVWAVRNIGNPPQGFNTFIAADLAELGVGERNSRTDIGSPQFSDMDIWGLSAELNWDFELGFLGAARLTSISAYRSWKISTAQDVDNISPIGPTLGRVLLNLNGGHSETGQWSQEVRVANAGSGALDYVLGIYLWGQDLERFFERGLDVCTVPGCPPATGLHSNVFAALFGLPTVGTQYAYFNTNVDTFNAAAFGQLHWRITHGLGLTAGFRFTQDDLDYDFDRRCPAAAPGAPCAIVPAATAFATQGGADDTDLSGKFGLQYEFSDLGMVYVSWTQGYKAQAFDIVFGLNAARAANQPIDPETSDAYELGAKLQLAGGQVLLGAAAFHMIFDNYHSQSFDSGTNAFVLQNAGSVVSQGVELDWLARPLENLTITGGLAWTDAFIDEFPTGPCYAGQTGSQGCMGRNAAGANIQGMSQQQNLADGEIPNSPDWKLSLQARYDIITGGPLDFYVQGNLRWQDDFLSHINQNPALKVDAYAIVDLALGVRSVGGHWDLSFYAENLFDEFYPALLIETPLNNRGQSHYLNRDHRRYFGARMRYNF